MDGHENYANFNGSHRKDPREKVACYMYIPAGLIRRFVLEERIEDLGGR